MRECTSFCKGEYEMFAKTARRLTALLALISALALLPATVDQPGAATGNVRGDFDING